MKRPILLGTGATCFCLGFVVPLLAAPAPTSDPPAGVSAVSVPSPAGTCRSDVQAFYGRMEKDGYWLDGSGYGYGYPMGALGYGDGYGYATANPPGYRNTRPG